MFVPDNDEPVSLPPSPKACFSPPVRQQPSPSGLPVVSSAELVAEPSPAPQQAAVPPAAELPTSKQQANPASVPATDDRAESAIQPPGTVTAESSEASPTGYLGRLKGRVAEMETVQKSMQFVADKSKQVAENERVQQSVEFVKKKTSEIAESESVQKGLAIAKDTAKVVGEKTSVGIEAAKDTAKVVGEKTAHGIEKAKEKTKAMAESAGAVWQKGRGSISRVRETVTNQLAWQGSARDTLNMEARAEIWKNLAVQGAEEMIVPARTEHTSAYHVKKGSTLHWTFRVKERDVGFGVRMRVQEWGGSREEEVLPIERYDAADTISGSWVADEDRTMILAFDNTFSKLRSKTVAFIVGTEKPSTYTVSDQGNDVGSTAAPSVSAAADAQNPPAAPPASAPVTTQPKAIV